MIPRILVPIDARPPAAVDAPTQRRRPTTMDERTLVPAMLPIVSLNGQSTIPTNLPLDSIAARVVVPRDLSTEAYGVKEDLATPLQPTDMDERITVPQGAAPLDMNEPMLSVPTDLVDPDIFITGEVHLAAPEAREDKAKWQVITRVSSVAFHVLMLTWIPPESSYSVQPRAQPRPAQPSPKMHVDPRVLREVAPPIIPSPAPAPQPERPVKELPNAPLPKQNVTQPAPQTQPGAPLAKGPLKLETPDSPVPHPGLVLPKETSPSQSIQDSLRAAAQNSGPTPIGGGGRIQGSGGRGGGGGGGTAFGGLEMLTPTEGVDFQSYLERVYVTVKRNWFAVMPESAELGERGIVVLTFKIMRDGSVPSNDPEIQRNSGKEPLDRAALSSVRASNPFEQLPAQFKGPYIELRYTYLYNIPIESYYQQK